MLKLKQFSFYTLSDHFWKQRLDRAMVVVVSHRLQSQGSPGGFCDGQSVPITGFSKNFFFQLSISFNQKSIHIKAFAFL